MNTVHLTDEELGIARHALEAYLRAFGHDEADILHAIKDVLAKFRAPESESQPPHVID
jgi:hypothetical protein